MIVETLYFYPTPEQMKESEGIEIDSEMPQPNDIHGMCSVLKLDIEKAQLYYDYEKPDTLESRVAERK